MIDLYSNEKIILQKRKHWYIISSESSILFFAAIVPIMAFISLLPSSAVKEIISPFLALIVFALSAWLLMLWIIFFIFWTNYYLDVLVITNKRIIDIEQHGLFARDLVEVRLEHIQDIKVEVFGVVASMLDFGNIIIQTAGQSKEIIVKGINHPDLVRKTISKQQHEMKN